MDRYTAYILTQSKLMIMEGDYNYEDATCILAEICSQMNLFAYLLE